MFNQTSEEFFNEKMEDDDFPAEFFLQPETSHVPSLPQPDPSNHFNLFLENDHFSMDLSAVKNLKSQIINSDLLIENNERLKKKLQELEFENKELKLISIKSREQDHQKVLSMESKLKAAEMINMQFKEQLALSKENAPQINNFVKEMKDKVKALEKTLKVRDDEIRRRDEEMRQKDGIIEDLKRHLGMKEQELKILRDQKNDNINKGSFQKKEDEGIKLRKLMIGVKKRLRKLRSRFLRSEIGIKENIKGNKKENEDIKEEFESYKNEMTKIRETQEESFKAKFEKFKEEILTVFPEKILDVLQNPEMKNKIKEMFPSTPAKMDIEHEEIGLKEESIKITQNNDQNLDNKPLLENKPEIQNEGQEISLEKLDSNPLKIEETPVFKPAKKNTTKKQKLQEAIKNYKPLDEKANKTTPEKKTVDPTDPLLPMSILENSFDSGSKIRKVPKKSTSISKDFDELLLQNPPQPKDLLKAIFPFYFKKSFVQAKSINESYSKPIFAIITQISAVITPQNLLEILQEASPNFEPFEVSLSFEEFLSDLSQITEDMSFVRLLEGVRESLKTPYVVQWKWMMKTRNQKYLNEDKKASFIDFFLKTSSSNYFDKFLQDLNEDPFEKDNNFKILQSMSPISFQLNNDFLDLITVNLLKGYQKKEQNNENLRFLYDLITQKFYLPRTETLLNLIYSIILLSPKTLQDVENKDAMKTYDILWILQIGVSQIWTPPYGPLTLQAIRLAIVDICNNWKILNRASQNQYLHLEFQRKTLFILLRLYELLEKGQSSDVLFGLFNYESICESFQEGLSDKKRGMAIQNISGLPNNPMNNNKAIINPNKPLNKTDDWPWFRGLNLDPVSLSSLLTNNLINILDKSLFYWDGLIVNNTVNLRGVLDLNDILATMGVYMGHQGFFMTGLLQKNLLGFVYNKKYDQTFQRTFSLLSLSMMCKNNGEKEIIELLLAILQERVSNIRVGQMDKVAALYCLWKRFNANIKDLIEENRANLNPFILDMMNYLAFNKNSR